MLFIYLYKITFFYFMCFLIYNNVYPKYCQGYKKDLSMKSENLSWETIIKELDFLRKTVTIQ